MTKYYKLATLIRMRIGIQRSYQELNSVILPTLLILSIALASCSDLSALSDLSNKFSNEFGVDPAELNINNGEVLTVTFAIGSDGVPDGQEREDFARSVAEFVRDQYSKYPSLTSIIVSFNNQSEYGPVSIDLSEDSFTFETAELVPASD